MTSMTHIPWTLLREEEESPVHSCVGANQLYPFASQTRTMGNIPPAASTPSLQLGPSAVSHIDCMVSFPARAVGPVAAFPAGHRHLPGSFDHIEAPSKVLKVKDVVREPISTHIW